MSKVQAIHTAASSEAAIPEVPGLRDALREEADAERALAAVKQRLAIAEGTALLRDKDRQALVARAAAGEQVEVSALRLADEAIRDAEAALTLATAAMPNVQAAAQAAERRVSGIRQDMRAAAKRQLRAEYDDAEEALTEAKAARDQAHVRAGVDVINAPLPMDMQHDINARIAAHR